MDNYPRSNLFVGKYDPIIGIQTGGILGGCLLLATAYAIYKAKCGRNHWTSTDRLFIEKYKQKLDEQSKYKNKSYQPVPQKSVDEGAAQKIIQNAREKVLKKQASIELTAHWLNTQPLDSSCENITAKRKCPYCNCSNSNSSSTEASLSTLFAKSLMSINNTPSILSVASALNSTKDITMLPLYNSSTFKPFYRGDQNIEKCETCFLPTPRPQRRQLSINMDELNVKFHNSVENDDDVELSDREYHQPSKTSLLSVNAADHPFTYSSSSCHNLKV